MILALILAAEAVEGERTLVADPFAPARAGLIECSRPDLEHHTCRALTQYEVGPDGNFVSRSLMQIRGQPSMSIEMVGAGRVTAATIIWSFPREFLRNALVFENGRLLAESERRPVISRAVKELRPLFKLLVESTYWKSPDGLVEIDQIVGDPEPIDPEKVIWVKPDEGFTVNGTQFRPDL